MPLFSDALDPLPNSATVSLTGRSPAEAHCCILRARSIPPNAGASRSGGEPAGMRNRVAWGLVVVVAVALLGGIGGMFARLKSYWVAKYRGQEAPLQGAGLSWAPLRNANLRGAKLH